MAIECHRSPIARSPHSQVSCKINTLDVQVVKYYKSGKTVIFEFDDFYLSDSIIDKRSLLRYDAFFKEAPFKLVTARLVCDVKLRLVYCSMRC